VFSRPYLRRREFSRPRPEHGVEQGAPPSSELLFPVLSTQEEAALVTATCVGACAQVPA
jgi:hypothetical protein